MNKPNSTENEPRKVDAKSSQLERYLSRIDGKAQSSGQPTENDSTEETLHDEVAGEREDREPSVQLDDERAIGDDASSLEDNLPQRDSKDSSVVTQDSAAAEQGLEETYDFGASALDLDECCSSPATPQTSEGLRRVRKKTNKKERAKHRRVKRVKLVLKILVGVIILVLLAGFALVKCGESNLKKAVTYTEGSVVEYNGDTYKLNENIISLCFIGYDLTTSIEGSGRAGQADVILVLTFDAETGKVKAINIPRDAMVEVDEMVGDAFLGVDRLQACLAFAYGDGREKSCLYTVRVAERILYNMPIGYYFALNMQGVGPLNNAVGGVLLTPLTTISSEGIYEGQPLTLSGDQAMSYVRSRPSNALDSSEMRQQRQMQYVKAYAAQALENASGDPSILVDLYNVANDYSITNLGPAEVSYLASLLVTKGVSDIEIVTLPGESVYGDDGRVELTLDEDAVRQTVLDTFYVRQEPKEQNTSK